MITEDFLSKISAYIEGQITQCQYVIDGNLEDLPIYSKEVSNSTVKINILLDENVEGTITEFKLYDTEGQLAKQENCTIVKAKGRGLFKTFNISISEVE